MSNRSRAWTITINNPQGEPDEVYPASFEALFQRERIDYLVAQLEKGKDETPHVQGYIIFTNPRTRRGVSRLPELKRAHLEVAIAGAEANTQYCTKEESRTDGPWTFGTQPPGQGTRTDLLRFIAAASSGISRDTLLVQSANVYSRSYRWAEAIVQRQLKINATERYTTVTTSMSFEASERLPSNTVRVRPDKRVYVFFGESGTGKTSAVFRTFGPENIFRLVSGDGSNDSVWFDGYQGEDVLLLDDYYGQLKWSFFLQLLDIYPLRVAVKGSFTYVNFPIIILTSNVEPAQWYSRISRNPTMWGAFLRRASGIFCFTDESSKWRAIDKLVLLVEGYGNIADPYFAREVESVLENPVASGLDIFPDAQPINYD